MTPLVADLAQSRRFLAWLIVLAASIEFLLQALVAIVHQDTFEGAIWSCGFVAIVVVAFSIETIKARVNP